AQGKIASDLSTIGANNTTIASNLSSLAAEVATIKSDLADLVTRAADASKDATTITTLNADIGYIAGVANDLSGPLSSQINAANIVSANKIATLTNANATGPGTIGGANSLGQYVGLVTTYETAVANDNATIATASDQPASAPSYQTVNVPPVVTRIANININAESLTGSASARLYAPGNSTITITNNTADTLVMDSLTIPQYDAGHVRFNGVLVNSNSDINRLQPNTPNANFGGVTTAANTQPPSVTILSNYNPDDSAFYNPSSPLYAFNTKQAPPDIQLNAGSAITNLNGSVTITSAAGNIYIDGVINAGSVNILAKNGDFVSAYVDGFDHIGGDPASFADPVTGQVSSPNQLGLGAGITANGAISISARYLDINSTIQSGIATWSLDLPAAPSLTALTSTDIGISAAQIQTAQQTYQSSLVGNPNASPLIPISNGYDTFTYDAATGQLQFSVQVANDYVAHNPNSLGVYTVTNATGNIGVSYDAKNTQYDIDGTSVHGGYVQLYGDIMNTSQGAGQINVLDGFGTIDLVNNTNIPVVLQTLDAGADSTGTMRGTQGVIDITDVTNVDATTNPLAPLVDITHTIYTRSYNPSNPSSAAVVVQMQKGYIDDTTGNAIYSGTDAASQNLCLLAGCTGALQTIATPGGISSSSGYVDSTRASQYDPTQYQRYVWTTATDSEVTFAVTVDATEIFGSSSLTVSSTTQFDSVTGPNVVSGPTRLADGTYVTSGPNGQTLTGTTQLGQGGIVPTTNVTSPVANSTIENVALKTATDLYVTSFTSTETGSHRDCNWWTLCIASDEITDYTLDEKYTTIVTNSLKADNPIAINFIGSNTGSIAVNSAASVILTDAVNNKAGTTTIAVTGSSNGVANSIIQGSTAAIINAKSIDLEASGSVGGVTNRSNPAAPSQAPIQISLSQVKNGAGQFVDAGGSLTAKAGAGNVDIATQGDLTINTVTAQGSQSGIVARTAGDVTLVAGGDIVAANSNALVEAPFVQLSAQNGSIGSLAAPLQVNVGYTSDSTLRQFGDPTLNPAYSLNPYFGLKASAAGDIGVAESVWSGNTLGNLLVDTVVSTGGSVLLQAPGQILDNNPAQTVDSRTYTQLLNYWNSLDLLGATDKTAATIAAFQKSTMQEYDQYWRIRDSQADRGATYDPNFAVTIAPGSQQYQALAAQYASQIKAANPNISATDLQTQVSADISAFAVSQTQQYHLLNSEVGGLTAAFDANYVFTPTAAQIASLTSGAVWTQQELAFSLSAGVLKTVT
ncbi:MAG TPA: hypothetical protein VKV96_01200, partial [Roseiarcus sp.]|nr:hypothetical protein [Roseiarcus sp.]